MIRIKYRNKVVSVAVDRLYSTMLTRARDTRHVAVTDRWLRYFNKYTAGSVLVRECFQVSSRVRHRSYLNKQTCNEYFNLVADVLYYLNVCSRRHSYVFAKDLVYELTLPTWEKLHRDNHITKLTDGKELTDNFCCDLEYFSYRWSLSRLFRSVYSFGDLLVHDSINVYDLCYNNRFHKWSAL